MGNGGNVVLMALPICAPLPYSGSQITLCYPIVVGDPYPCSPDPAPTAQGAGSPIIACASFVDQC